MDIDNLIILLENPPKVSKGVFNWISLNCNFHVIYYCYKDFDEYRKRTNWNDGDYGKCELVFKDSRDTNFLLNLAKNPRNYFVFSGFTNNVAKKYLISICSLNRNIYVFSERPNIYGNFFTVFFKNCLWFLRINFLSLKYSKRIRVLLPLGQTGVNSFKRFGWKGQMNPFMYNPVDPNNYGKFVPNKGGKIKIAYVGRFSYKTKGLDVLMKAIDLINDSSFQFDFIGGYGDKRNQVLKWLSKKENVRYLGSWDSMRVCDNLKKYDAVVIPSRFDGWNLLVNEGINAGIAIIVSDQAVSHEVVQLNDSGLIFHANNVLQLKNSILSLLNREKLNFLKQKSCSLQSKISNKSIGVYFLDIISNNEKIAQQKIIAPWQKR